MSGNGDRIAKGTLSSFSCNLSSNGFAIQNAYVVGQAGEQLSEMGSTQNWLHMNVFAGGKLVATYGGGTTYFALSDWLGTKRVETVPNGTCLSTYASLAYGDELTPSGNCPDATEHHYTTKEHDAESGNDFFLARYYSSTAGRFISPDWASGAEAVPYATFGDPQSLNLYVYVGNNPFAKADLNGHQWMCLTCLVNSAKQYAADHPRTMQALKGAGQIAVGTAGLLAAGTTEVGSSGLATAGVVFLAQGSTASIVKGVTNIAGAATNTDVSEATKGLDAVANPAAQVTTAVTGNTEKGAAAGAIADFAITGANASDMLKGSTAAKAIKIGEAGLSGAEAGEATKNIIQQRQQQEQQQQNKAGNCSTQNACN